MSLRLITGRVRSGKTSYLINEIKEAVRTGTARSLLLVPEQYSHEAERELCEACGDRLSLYAEVMSFSGFARWSTGAHGGGAELRMDQGGRLLCMMTALKELQPTLKVFERAAENTDMLQQLLVEAEKLRTASVGVEALRVLAAKLDGDLGEKLKELALILETYDTVAERTGGAAEEPLELLARQLEQYGLNEFDRIYVDGFIDFTGLEQKVLRTLMHLDKELTVCLPAVTGSREEFLLPSRLAAEALCEDAKALNAAILHENIEGKNREADLLYFFDHMFDYGAAPAEASEGSGIRLLLADNPRLECEAAAAEILRAVREEGCRWRDIAVAVRGFEDYRGILETTFRRYGIPLFLTRRDSIAEKPLPLWIESAYDILLSGWDSEDVITWLRCGLSGLTGEDCDELSRYIGKWKIKGEAWLHDEPWRQHPDGYGRPWTDDDEARLRRINHARRAVAGPLLKLKERASAAETAADQTAALALFLEEAHIGERLEERVTKLEAQGKLELRDEYSQIWDICMGALQQIKTVLGEATINTEVFQSVFQAVIAQYDIGLIPVALDRVSAGDFDRMRRRNIQRLIVLGCSDDRLPRARGSEGVFNTEERDILAEHKLQIGGGEAELWREYAMIYHTIALPHESLILSCPATGLKGEIQVPAMVWNQARRIFQIHPEVANREKLRLWAVQPALTLAMAARQPGSGPEAKAAAAWYRAADPERVKRLEEASVLQRTNLSHKAVEALYGKRLRLSPSRIESFANCRFGYYCGYGLRAEEDEPAAFRAPEIGTFVHSVLERTGREVAARGGFRQVTDAELKEIADCAVKDYIHTELSDFREKTARFRHLFERICADVYRIVADMAEELRRSDFVPLSFELDISRLPAKTIDAETEWGKDLATDPSGEKGKTELLLSQTDKLSPGAEKELWLTGIADRVDGWIQGDTLWLRVVDYKTGRKKFSLSDIQYGRNMQMLLYMFAVCDSAGELYGKKALPAGVMYIPAREELLQFDRAPNDEETARQRTKGKRRSGLVLDDPALIEAWEQGSDKQYIPVRVTTSNPLVSLEQMGQLRRHAEHCLQEAAEEILAGSISANPSYNSESDNACQRCPYHSICRFEEGENGEFSSPTPKLKDEEVWKLLQEER